MGDAVTVYVEPVDKASRLDALGLNEPLLLEAVGLGSGYALDCTAHDPPNMAGIMAYGKITRALRDRLVPQGWESNDSRGYSTTIHPNRTYAIVVAGGDAHTGLPDQTPSTRSEKGPATKDAVAVNQRSFAELGDDFRRAMEPTGMQTWFLLHYEDMTTHEIRSELALPAAMTGDGRIAMWRERVILSPIPIDRSTVALEASDEPALDIPVERRAQ